MIGLAAATTEHLAFREVWIPALEMVTVCCSMTSWIATLSFSPILSNSSMQTTPLSARTMAPASSLLSPVSLSLVTAAVRPTPLEPLPVVEMDRGAMFITERSIWDLATPGSPTMSKLMSPLRWVPFFRFFSMPPSSSKTMAFLMKSWPKMEGARDWARSSKQSSLWEILLMFLVSLAVSLSCWDSLPMLETEEATRRVLKTPLIDPAPLEGAAL
mmetsp:Transcript_984/g.2916  ORF Transcript_984/g.2916 Transcript_984/m.2916 type:complete len:215 (+) Transcript_984:5005-5649(+)